MTSTLKNGSPFQVWILDTSRDCGGADFDSMDTVEKGRYLRLARVRDRQAFVMTRLALRRLLADAVDTPPQSIRFAQNLWGKPSIAPDGSRKAVDFNVSHTDGLSAIALSDGRRIGIDVERERNVFDKTRIAAEVFGPVLAGELCGLSGAAQDRFFLRLWTIAEAFVKATGTGFAGLAERIPLSLSRATGEIRLGRGPAGGSSPSWAHFPLALPEGYCGSVVVENLDRGGEIMVPVAI